MSLSLQIAGPAHVHRAVESITRSAAFSWRPINPVFRHSHATDARADGHPPGFAWAATLKPTQTAARMLPPSAPHRHDDGHTSARHHHDVGDQTIVAEITVSDVDSSASGAGAGQGGAGLMAWATPVAGFRWASSTHIHPEAAGMTHCSDVIPKPPERPPRVA